MVEVTQHGFIVFFDIHLARHRIQMKEIGVELCQTQFKEFKVILKLFVSYMSNFGIGYPMFWVHSCSFECMGCWWLTNFIIKSAWAELVN